MTNTDKRARQKERRAAILAAQQAAQRRRRVVQLVAALVVVAVVVGFGLFSGANEGGDGGGGAAAGGDGCFESPAQDKRYSAPPEMSLEDGVDYKAVIQTSMGDIRMDLLEEDTPQTVNNFICLARDGFYDGLTFHRIEKDLVVQGGDPEGTGAGGPGYAIGDELPQGQKNPYVFGTVGMANSGPNTGGSQFFIVVHDPDPKGGFEPTSFPPNYPVFGKVDPTDEESVATLEKIANAKVRGGTSPNAAQPVEPIIMETIEISEA